MSFSEEVIQKVWEKGTVIQNNDPNVWRKDQCGAWINRSVRGDTARDSMYGWEIHHVNPNGGDDISNLIPLQWENNLATGDTGKLVCAKTSLGTKNIKK
jgi:hypothetical protein